MISLRVIPVSNDSASVDKQTELLYFAQSAIRKRNRRQWVAGEPGSGERGGRGYCMALVGCVKNPNSLQIFIVKNVRVAPLYY